MTKIKALFWAIFLVCRAIHRNGLRQTVDALDSIHPQVNFWFDECKRLYLEAEALAVLGDVDNYRKIARQHQAAVERFKKEACKPMDELTGIHNSIADL